MRRTESTSGTNGRSAKCSGDCRSRHCSRGSQRKVRPMAAPAATALTAHRAATTTGATTMAGTDRPEEPSDEAETDARAYARHARDMQSGLGNLARWALWLESELTAAETEEQAAERLRLLEIRRSESRQLLRR